MAVPSSGQLRLNADINLEVNGTASGTNVSLVTLSGDAGFDAPDAMTDFYGYTDAVAPSVSTSSNSSITQSSMTANGNVSSDGGATVTSRGFYFGTSSNYASNSKYTVGSGTGSFSKSFTGLSSSSTYYSTAFAINSVGEVRGSSVSSTTSAPSLINSMIVTSGSNMPKTCTEHSHDGQCDQFMYYGRLKNSTGGTVSVNQTAGGHGQYTQAQGLVITYYSPWPSAQGSVGGHVAVNGLPSGFDQSNFYINATVRAYQFTNLDTYANHVFSKSGYISYTHRLLTLYLRP